MTISVTSALLAVLSSGTRRKPDYIRQQALVSFMYPYFQPAEKLAAQDTVYDFSVIYVPPPIFYEAEAETIQAIDSVYQVFAKSIRQEVNTVESLQADNSIYSIFAKDILRAVTYSESLEAQNSIYGISAPSVGLYSEYAETLSAANSIYQIYAGPIQ